MQTVVFTDKDTLVNFLYKKLTNPTIPKIQKTLYLLYAFYGATYGNLKSKNDFIEEDYPKHLFTANFIAGKYGPVEIDVYKKQKLHKYNNIESDITLFSKDESDEKLVNITMFINNIVRQTNLIDDYMSADRTKQDKVWKESFCSNDKTIDNQKIISEYIERYI